MNARAGAAHWIAQPAGHAVADLVTRLAVKSTPGHVPLAARTLGNGSATPHAARQPARTVRQTANQRRTTRRGGPGEGGRPNKSARAHGDQVTIAPVPALCTSHFDPRVNSPQAPRIARHRQVVGPPVLRGRRTADLRTVPRESHIFKNIFSDNIAARLCICNTAQSQPVNLRSNSIDCAAKLLMGTATRSAPSGKRIDCLCPVRAVPYSL